MDPLDQNTIEPCLLLRDHLGQWYYNTGIELNRLVQSFSLDIPCEKQLRYRLIEKYLVFRKSLLSTTLNVKSGQQVWIERKHASERWIVETPLFTGPNENHRCRQLEVTYARCCETRMNIYCSYLFREEDRSDELDRSQRAERDALLRKQKKIRDVMMEESFDLHPTKGWFHRDAGSRIRQIGACCNATKIQADPTIAAVITSTLSRSQYLTKMPSEIENASAASAPNAEEGAEGRNIEANGEAPMQVDEAIEPTEDIADEAIESNDLPKAIESQSKFENIDTEQIHKRSTAIKAIEQLHNITGEVVRIYPSGREAAAFMNISQSGISLCTNGLKTEANGFRWRSYEGPTIDCKFRSCDLRFLILIICTFTQLMRLDIFKHLLKI